MEGKTTAKATALVVGASILVFVVVLTFIIVAVSHGGHKEWPDIVYKVKASWLTDEDFKRGGCFSYYSLSSVKPDAKFLSSIDTTSAISFLYELPPSTTIDNAVCLTSVGRLCEAYDSIAKEGALREDICYGKCSNGVNLKVWNVFDGPA